MTATPAPPTTLVSVDAPDIGAHTVTYLADITDPTSDGILINLVNIGLSALMVIVALVGGWYAFKAWSDAKGGASSVKAVRDVAFGVLAIEAFLGGVIFIANYGSSIIPGLT